jgi:quercetin dioxygenase-like cupin family protein
MEWVDLDHGGVTEYGSHGIHMSEAARLHNADEFRVHLATVAPGGTLGRHPTRLWQLFAVTSGSGWVTASDGARQPIRTGEAVLWSPGEEHESGSDEGMSVVITQSSVRLPRGGEPQT